MWSCGCSESEAWCGCWSSNGRYEMKVYRALIFCVPILFTLILLFLFYVLYLRPRWPRSTRRPRPSASASASGLHNLGLNKELREMLPIILYKQTFSVKDTRCSVCLLEYQADDRLQQIPGCGHTFHIKCIDLWLSTHSTCPLCRFSLLSTHTSHFLLNNQQTQAVEFSESRSTRNLETTVPLNVSGEVAISTQCIDVQGQNVQNNH